MSDATDERPAVRMLGTHGVPANYGGFETAAENIALYLVEHGWRAIVYCQTNHSGPIYEDEWRGIERVNISVPDLGWRGTAKFDWLSICHAVKHRDVCLTFGYNTGIFNVLQRIFRVPNVINMDGIEWSRKRWGLLRQSILYINERFAAFFGNQLIADHPELMTYLRTRAPKRKITTITYGAHRIEDAPTDFVEALGLQPKQYLTLIARPLPENSILELVRGFSAKKRGISLAVLGRYEVTNAYHREVLDLASDEVWFLGAIYEPAVVQALRFHAIGYLHGHTVGGTNPSLVEALAAGNPVVAHNNEYTTGGWPTTPVFTSTRRWTQNSVSITFKPAGFSPQTKPECLAAIRNRVHLAERCWAVRGAVAKESREREVASQLKSNSKGD